MPERPALLVWSSLFPNPVQPQAGVFIRERMFRVGAQLSMVVVAPQPWFPLQGLIRRWRPHFRPPLPEFERQKDIEVWRPRYFSVPGIAKRFDGWLMARGAWRIARSLHREGRVDLIDAHFAYPDGYAAAAVAKRLGVPCTITLRGTEVRHARQANLRSRLFKALTLADRVFAVSDSLRNLAIELGIGPTKVRTVGNGVDAAAFAPLPRAAARVALGIAAEAQVLITVGGLVERKGFHRVIACLPALLKEFPALHYLAVGSPGPEGDYSSVLRKQVQALNVADRVHFLGALPAAGVRQALSAADVFVLSTRNEGWANVLLESLACGVPVVASDVGGNAEVICRDDLGSIVPFDDHSALLEALRNALSRRWDREELRRYAEANDWRHRVDVLLEEFRNLYARRPSSVGAAELRIDHAR